MGNKSQCHHETFYLSSLQVIPYLRAKNDVNMEKYFFPIHFFPIIALPMFNLYRKGVKIEVLKEKADEYVDQGLLTLDKAKQVCKVIEQELSLIHI